MTPWVIGRFNIEARISRYRPQAAFGIHAGKGRRVGRLSVSSVSSQGGVLKGGEPESDIAMAGLGAGNGRFGCSEWPVWGPVMAGSAGEKPARLSGFSSSGKE